MARARSSSRGGTAQRSSRRAVATDVLAWEDDPGVPGGPAKPITSAIPDPAAAKPPIRIGGRAPQAKEYQPGTQGFRYWTAAEALSRGVAFWSSIVPGLKWQATVGRSLAVGLDEGEDLNAFYNRRSLQFFHASVGGVVVYSGESPDVVCHELGHAVLDAVRPELWNAASSEIAAFHESFGDMSAMLSALQVKSFRDGVIVATGGNLTRSSRLSRLAEQLGWAIRQFRPDAVDADCLRNAVNSFFYSEPIRLPPSAPAASLSSEPHSFSRVFTGGFLHALAGMLSSTGGTSDDLLQVSTAAAQLLIDGVAASPVVPSYFSQVAAHMLEADRARFNGRYAAALKAGLVRHGVLSLQSAVSPPEAVSPPRRLGIAGGGRAGAAAVAALAPIAISGHRLGLGADLVVEAPAEPLRFNVAGAALAVGATAPPSHEQAAASFVEDLFRRGRVDTRADAAAAEAVTNAVARKTHALARRNGSLVLERQIFDCGFDVAVCC